MANFDTLKAKLAAIANAIRYKSGTSTTYTIDQMPSAIRALEAGTGGIDTSDATLTSGSQMLSGYTAYSNDVKYTGTIASMSGQTITPSTSSQTVSTSGKYMTGNVLVKGDSNLTAGNIVSGVSIFGVSGTAASGGTDTSDATLTSGSQMLSGYTAYSNGTKYTGSISSMSRTTVTPSASSQTVSTSGKYMTGNVIVSGDSNLVSSNIISGVSIFGISGSVVINKYYTGSSAPASTLGSDGDIYLQV